MSYFHYIVRVISIFITYETVLHKSITSLVMRYL